MFDTDTLIILVICFSSKPKTEELVKSLILSGDYLPTSETNQSYIVRSCLWKKHEKKKKEKKQLSLLGTVLQFFSRDRSESWVPWCCCRKPETCLLERDHPGCWVFFFFFHKFQESKVIIM